METLEVDRIEKIGISYFQNNDTPSITWEDSDKLIAHSFSGKSVTLIFKTQERFSITYPLQVYLKIQNYDGYKIAQISSYEKVNGGTKVNAIYKSE